MDLIERTLIERNGFWWPADDAWCHKVAHVELDDLSAAVDLTVRREVAVQAGGNVGVWADHLARQFGRVETAEPDALNYHCLARNVPSNVRHRQAGYGDRPKRAGMSLVAGNAGAHYIDGAGGIEIITIDSLALEACDLICLDVEGYEPLALRGAEATIRKYRPVVMFEEKGLSERYYGIPPGSSERWVLALGLGYDVARRVRKDVIMVSGK